MIMVATENWLKLSCTHSWSIKVARISSANTVSGLAFSSVLVLFLLIQHLSCRPPPLPLRWCPSIAVTITAPVRPQQPYILHPRFDHSKCELSCAVVLCCVVVCQRWQRCCSFVAHFATQVRYRAQCVLLSENLFRVLQNRVDEIRK